MLMLPIHLQMAACRTHAAMGAPACLPLPQHTPACVRLAIQEVGVNLQTTRQSTVTLPMTCAHSGTVQMTSWT